MSSSGFAAAHGKILERRRQRQSASAQQHHHDNQSQTSSVTRRIPPLLLPYYNSITEYASLATGREGTRPSFRVGQLDSELLDTELLDLFKTQVSDALKYYSPHIIDDYSSEIALILRAILFKLTIWDHNSSYGASLQNLHYTDARSHSPSPTSPTHIQKILLGLLSIGGPYAWTKWQDRLVSLTDTYMYSDSPAPLRIQLAERLTSLANTAHSFAAFASFTLFLLNGRYRTLLDRVLRLRLTPKTSQLSREVSFEYLNRQLVWHAFTEFLLFLLPLVGIARWRRWLAKAWRRTQQIFRRRSGDDEAEEATVKSGELAFLPERTCAICYQDQNPTSAGGVGESDVAALSASAMGTGSGVVGSAQTDVTNPYEGVPCGCVYCFVCLAQRLDGEEGEGWVCLRCGEVIKAARPWSGDVLEEAAGNGSESFEQHAATANSPVRDVSKEQDLKEKDISSSPNTSPRSSMSRGSNKSSPSKSVTFADDVIDNSDYDTNRAQSSMSIIDPMPLDDDDEELDQASVTTADDLIDTSMLVDSSAFVEPADWDEGVGSAEASLLSGDEVDEDVEDASRKRDEYEEEVP